MYLGWSNHRIAEFVCDHVDPCTVQAELVSDDTHELA
jgi:hypothetical protein